MGVTAIAAVNGPGSYARRYEATRQLLEREPSSRRRPVRPNKATRRRIKTWAEFQKLAAVANAPPKKRREMYRSYYQRHAGRLPPASAWTEAKPKAKAKAKAKAKPRAKAKPKPRAKAPLKRAKKRQTKADWVRMKRREKPGASDEQLNAWWNSKKRGDERQRAIRASKQGRAAVARTPAGREAARRKRMLKAPKKTGKKTGKKRQTKADWERAQRRKHPGVSDKQLAAWWKMGQASKKRYAASKRQRAEAKRKKQVRRYGKGKFKAARARVGSGVPTDYWTYMYRDKGGRMRKIPVWALAGYSSSRAAQKVRDEGSPRRQRALEKRLEAIRVQRDKAVAVAKRQIERGTGRYAMFSPNQERTITYEEWEEDMRANSRRRRRKKSTKKRRTRRVRRNPVHASARKAAPKRRRRRKASTRKGMVRTTARRAFESNRPKRKRKRKSTRKGMVRRTARRAYRKNQAATFGGRFVEVLQIGGVVAVGFVVQKAATTGIVKAIGDKFPESVSKFKGSLVGLGVAAAGVLIGSGMKSAAMQNFAAGMGAGLVHTVAKEALAAFAPDYADYLGALPSQYTNAEGNPQYSGYGSYYEFSPHQVFDGVGEYYETAPAAVPTSGFGQLPQLYQAAAAYGQAPPGIPQLTQQAAGYGNLDVNQLTQAAAGLGAPMLTQAAAGAMGEYVVSGGKGIGEYEEVTPEYQKPTTTDEGIHPDLTSAEYAMSIAEAAAGVGAFGDSNVPLQSIVNPTGHPEAIPDMPGGSRAGTFAGPNGVFGPGH